MREIKFRGKKTNKRYDYKTKKYYYDWIIGSLTVDKDTYVIYGNDNPTEGHFVDRETVGQYTGLKDINGVEIYEGDRIRYVHEDDVHYDEDDNIVTTDWIESQICWGGSYPAFDVKGHDSEYNLLSCDEYIIEVIGNIHDIHDNTKEETQ